MFNKFTFNYLKKTFPFKSVDVYKSASAYKIAVQLLFSFKNVENVFMKLRKIKNCY